MNKKGLEPGEFDVRMVEWNLKHELITKESLEKHLKALNDEGENCELLRIDDEEVLG